MVIQSAKEVHEIWRKAILKKYLDDIPVEKEFEIASKINKALRDGLSYAVYDGIWEGEIYNGKPLHESVALYLDAMGYTVESHKAIDSDRMNIHIRWDRPKDMTF